MVVDLSAGVQMTPKLKLTVGVNNLLNAYPTVQDADWTDGGGYSEIRFQMGTAGVHIISAGWGSPSRQMDNRLCSEI